MRGVTRILKSGRFYCDTIKVLQAPSPLVTRGGNKDQPLDWNSDKCEFLDIKTSHKYKDLFCVSSLMLSDCCCTNKAARHTVTPKCFTGYPSSNYRYILLHYYSIHSTFIRRKNSIIEKKESVTASVQSSVLARVRSFLLLRFFLWGPVREWTC